jgi:hypothetical protein
LHAVFVVSELDANMTSQTEEMLKTSIAPGLQRSPGFVRALWGRSADGAHGRSVIVFQSEDTARAALAQIHQSLPSDGPVRIVEGHVFEVLHEV